MLKTKETSGQNRMGVLKNYTQSFLDHEKLCGLQVETSEIVTDNNENVQSKFNICIYFEAIIAIHSLINLFSDDK